VFFYHLCNTTSIAYNQHTDIWYLLSCQHKHKHKNTYLRLEILIRVENATREREEENDAKDSTKLEHSAALKTKLIQGEFHKIHTVLSKILDDFLEPSYTKGVVEQNQMLDRISDTSTELAKLLVVSHSGLRELATRSCKRAQQLSQVASNAST